MKKPAAKSCTILVLTLLYALTSSACGSSIKVTKPKLSGNGYGGAHRRKGPQLEKV